MKCPNCYHELGIEGNPTNAAHADWFYCYNEGCPITYVGIWRLASRPLIKEKKPE